MISISGDAKTDLCLVILGWKGQLEKNNIAGIYTAIQLMLDVVLAKGLS